MPIFFFNKWLTVFLLKTPFPVAKEKRTKVSVSENTLKRVTNVVVGKPEKVVLAARATW